MTVKKIITAFIFFMLFAGKSFAFLGNTPEKIQDDLHILIASAGQGSDSAHAKLVEELDLYSKLDLIDRPKSEVLSYIQKLMKSNKFPSYIFERGSYNYKTGNNYLYVTGKNIPAYSLPVIQNSGITARLNTEGTDYMTYLGEWKPRTGNSWVFAQYMNSGKTCWIISDNVQLVPNNTFRRIISDIQRGLQQYNLTALRNTQRKYEVIGTVTEDSDSYAQDIENRITSNIRSAKSGNVSARKSLERMLNTWQEISSRPDLAKKSWEENDTYTQKLIHDKKVSGSLLGSGYKYNEKGIFIYTPRSAVLRVRPDNETDSTARTKANSALRYMGERVNRDNEKWFFAEDISGSIGWISERSAKLLKIEDAKSFTEMILEGLEGSGNIQEASIKKKEAYTTIAISAIVISLLITFMGLAKYMLNRDFH